MNGQVVKLRELPERLTKKKEAQECCQKKEKTPRAKEKLRAAPEENNRWTCTIRRGDADDGCRGCVGHRNPRTEKGLDAARESLLKKSEREHRQPREMEKELPRRKSAKDFPLAG